jgi:hypothetical protein
MISQIKKQYGIAIFHNIGDLLLCTPIPRQLKADDPACHITWYTSQRYAFVLNNNPYIDEVIALPDAPLYNLKIINILRPHATQENAGVLALRVPGLDFSHRPPILTFMHLQITTEFQALMTIFLILRLRPKMAAYLMSSKPM